MPRAKITDPDGIVDAFLDVEFLHSLGCYTNATSKMDEIAKRSIADAGGALRRTQELNELLRAERDDPGKPSRHPDPCKSLPAAKRRSRRAKRKEHEKGLLLARGSRERLQLITDFYSTGIAALDCLRNAGKATPNGKIPQLAELEQLGACLFWDRDPSSSAHGVNRIFQDRQNKLGEVREGRASASSIGRERPIEQRIEAKRQRFIERRRAVEDALKPRLTHQREWEAMHAPATAAKLAKTNLSTPSDGVVSPGFVLQCLVAAHLRLHHVEYVLSLPFRQAMKRNEVERGDVLRTLRESEALNTFVYAVCRSLPWIFAKGKEEMEVVIGECRVGFGAGAEGGDRNRPREAKSDVFNALWRAQRIAFLALHRRAFGHALRDVLVEESFNDVAFKDYHKLQRQLRVQRRIHLRAEEMSVLDAGDRAAISPHVFVAGMGALAETHIGDLYRSDHAHPVALEHFCDAQDRLEQLSERLLEEKAADGVPPEVLPVPAPGSKREGPDAVAEELRDSRWRVHLMMSKGKGFYEAGNLKRSVKWLLKSWSALLVLIDYQNDGLDSGTSENALTHLTPKERAEVFEGLSRAVEMLREIKNDPDFSKDELASKVDPIMDRIETTFVPANVRAIAAEILLRLGHVLYVLRLGPDSPTGKHELASRCFDHARSLDRHSTLIAADRLKIEYELRQFDEKASRKPALSNQKQWPFGRGNPDQIIRMIEYHLLWWLAVSGIHAQTEEVRGRAPEEAEVLKQNREVARRLIAGLLTHTDSINVRQSQVYRYLMQPKQPPRRIGPAEGWGAPGGEEDDADPAIEFICLRRYSSFFPFVPRPSAFRSLGGGYLLRLHHQDEGCPQPFGIAIDPGPDFIENLYRCGFGLGDINMIVLTHDHPDHSVDLDPILSLMGYRMKQGDSTFVPPPRAENVDAQARRLLIVGNESVAQRLGFFNKPHYSQPGAGNPKRQRPDAVQVVSFDEFDAFRKEMGRAREAYIQPEVAIPRELRLKPVVSIRHPDGFGMLAYGFRLSLGDAGPSIGFTGDTGGFILERNDAVDPSLWRVEPHDAHGTMKLTGASSWRDHWADVLDADVLIPHVSGLPLSQLLVLANEGRSTFEDRDPQLSALLSEVWNGLDDNARKQVGFAFWLPEDEHGIASLPLEEIQGSSGWPKGHLYLIGLLEFARAYQAQRESANKSGLFLIGELREELGSLRGKIAFSLNKEIFDSDVFEETEGDRCGCRALTADVGLRLMISRHEGEAQVRVLCSICDLDNDRTRMERFHDPSEIRDVCVKGENEGMFYNCSNHDPLRYAQPVFLERVERYDVFSDTPFH